jgi:hypothetical protein
MVGRHRRVAVLCFRWLGFWTLFTTLDMMIMADYKSPGYVI